MHTCRLYTSLIFRLCLFSFCCSLTAYAEGAGTNDFNGDGAEEFVFWQESTGTFTAVDRNGLVVVNPRCGLRGDIPLSGDLGPENPVPGRSTAIVWRPNTFPNGGVFFICNDDGSLSRFHPNGIPFGQSGDIPLLQVDFNGDGANDPTLFRPSTAEWFQIVIGAGADIVQFGQPGDVPVPADYDGDGRTDLAVFKLASGTWSIRRSRDGRVVERQWGLASDIPVPADYDGDRQYDLAVWRPDTGQWLIIPSSNPDFIIQASLGLPSDKPIPADVNGDGSADLAVFRPGTGEIFFDETRGQASPQRIAINIAGHKVTKETRRRAASNDFNADGISDFAVVRRDPQGLSWFVRDIFENQILGLQYGATADEFFAADFTGDGRTDIGIVRPVQNGEAFWSVRPTGGDGQEITTAFGAAGDFIVPGDYDNDKRADFAIARPDSNSGGMIWFVRSSATGRLIGWLWGLATDTPTRGDFNGDGLLDFTIVRSENGLLYWYTLVFDPFALENGTPVALEVVQWGLEGDVLAPSDYDGDGFTDHAVVRNDQGQLVLYVRVRGGRTLEPIPWGLAGDSVVPGSYRGALLSQPAVWRPKDLSEFFVNQGPGISSIVSWGLKEDIAVSPVRLARIPAVPGGNDNSGGDSGGNDDGGNDDGGSDDGGGSAVSCSVNTDFVDGGGGKLWKPVSESTGQVVVLMPREYWTSTNSIEVFDRSGRRILNGKRRTCCPNSNRAHYDIPERASTLRRSAPLTVRFNRSNGRKECHEVPNPSQRYD